MDDKDTSRIDPRGFIHKDIQFIRQRLPRVGYQKGDTLEDIAHRQGFHDCLEFIENHVIGRGSDHGDPTKTQTKRRRGSKI